MKCFTHVSTCCRRLFLVVFLCLISFFSLSLNAPAAHASNSCSWSYVASYEEVIPYGSSNNAHYFTGILGAYNSTGRFCHMIKAAARLTLPAHTSESDDELCVYLTDVHGTDITNGCTIVSSTGTTSFDFWAVTPVITAAGAGAHSWIGDKEIDINFTPLASI